MLTVGLTGGIACGKTEVARAFAALGARVIEADDVGHRLLRRRDIKALVVEAFGAEILDRRGCIDRRTLGRVVFRNHSALERLNAIIHPPLVEALRSELRRARVAGEGVFVLVAALLVEWGLDEEVDRVVVVDAPPAVQKHRLVRCGDMSEEDAVGRITAQVSGSSRRRKADFIVDGSAPLTEMLAEANSVWEALRREASNLSRDAPRAGCGCRPGEPGPAPANRSGCGAPRSTWAPCSSPVADELPRRRAV